MEHRDVQNMAQDILENMAKIMVGQERVMELVLTCVLAGGHVLLEDVPGTGKTTMARSLALSLGGVFHRIQFTPDLLPADITGMRVFRQATGTFEFIKGPVFTNVLLADEINRATPRTQSALLECMEEKQVSENGTSWTLPRPFLVIATQNPVETQGTFMLPEAQLDRFLMRLSMNMPDAETMVPMMERFVSSSPLNELTSVTSPEQLSIAIEAVRTCHVSHDILDYIARICQAARNPDAVKLGPSPRAAIALMRACQAYAVIRGRGFVIPDDVKELVVPVLSHRLIMRSLSRSVHASEYLQSVVDELTVPTEERL